MSSAHSLPELIARYRNKGILIDSSLLVVYLVGSFDRRQLVNCRAIKSSFSESEFDLLGNLVAAFEKVVTTPHVLTEVSNLAGRLPQAMHAQFRAFFADAISGLWERNIPAIHLASARHFVRFGVTDTALTLIGPGDYLVLTEELALFDYLSRTGVDVVNFNHIRLMV